MRIVEYTETRKNLWDDFVTSHPHSWTGHLSGIFVLEGETAGAVNHSLLVLDEQDHILALLPLYYVLQPELRFFKKRILCDGTHLCSGPLLSSNLSLRHRRKVLSLLMAEVAEKGKRLGAELVTISYPNIINGQTSLSYHGFFPLKHFGYHERNVVTMIKRLNVSEEELFDSLKPVCRRNIRRARKEDVVFEQIRDRDMWLGCHELNVQTMGNLAYSIKAMEIIWDEFVQKGTALVTAILYEDHVVNVTVTTSRNECFYYWFGFNSKVQVIPGAANLLFWETMLLYRQQGCSFFEVGSMEFKTGKQKDISRFKESFGGVPTYMLSGMLELRPFKRRLIDLLQVLRQRF